jgi:hypothetical protein
VVPEFGITADTVIDATGYDVTLDGNHANRVIYVYNNQSLTLRHITIANGIEHHADDHR